MELRADFRSVFGISAEDVGETISYTEAIYLIEALMKDTSTRFFAAKAKWDHPVSQEWILFSHLYDRFVETNTRKGTKAKRYPRPWKDPSIRKIGNKSIPLSRAKDFFAKLGYK